MVLYHQNTYLYLYIHCIEFDITRRKMFANIRNSISNAADDVSHRFEQTRRRHRRNNSRSSASSSSSASASSTRPRQRQRQQQQPSSPQQQQQQHPPPEAPQRAPPASMRAIKQLPTIRVAPEDLIDPINRECCICFEDNCLDEKVTRLRVYNFVFPDSLVPTCS